MRRSVGVQCLLCIAALNAHSSCSGAFFWELHDNGTGEGGIGSVVKFSVLVGLLVCGMQLVSPPL